MKKLDANQVAQLVANAGKGLLDSKELKELLGRIKDLLPDEAPDEEKAPPCKKQYVILISDPQGKLNDCRGELAGWVLQIPEETSPLSTEERLHKAAYDFNATRRGHKLPVQTIGETIESVPAKSLKEVEVWAKTKTPVLMLTTNNEIPNTDSLLPDEERGIGAAPSANTLDARIEEIVEWARTANPLSTSGAQKHFGVGYNAALHMMEALVACGHVREDGGNRYVFIAGDKEGGK